MSSNFPPGHPTGISRGEQSVILECEDCLLLIEVEHLSPAQKVQYKKLKYATCDRCSRRLTIAECECGKPATHIDVERAVNAAMAFCSEHGM